MAQTNPSKGQTIVQELQRELASMTHDLKDAGSKSKLGQFFSSADKGSPLERHNTALVKLIAGYTGVKVDEVLGSLRKIEGSKLQGSSSRKPTIVLGDLKGESGSPGGHGHIGGEGGEGGGAPTRDGPRRALQNRQHLRRDRRHRREWNRSRREGRNGEGSGD
ncbi:hypothetical protein B0H14DRAFT_3885010 [Mycena olivaceomarginata]|nr:hypothetical protein B0H14DRAFT_3885010 [Mycena olivaceomarginata]